MKQEKVEKKKEIRDMYQFCIHANLGQKFLVMYQKNLLTDLPIDGEERN